MSEKYERLSKSHSEKRNVFVAFFQNIIDGFGVLCCCTRPTSLESQQESHPNEEVVQVRHNYRIKEEVTAAFRKPTAKTEAKKIEAALCKPTATSRTAFLKPVPTSETSFLRPVPRPSREESLKPATRAAVCDPVPTTSARDTSIIKGLAFALLNEQKKLFEEQPDASLREIADDVSQKVSRYRIQAQEHHEKRKQFYEMAKNCLNASDRHFYFQRAKEQTRLLEEANKSAAAAILLENNENNPKDTIDLHRLFVKEAIQALDNFLTNQILSLKDDGLPSKEVTVITGRGKHSQSGVPKIKPAVIDRLEQRSLTYYQLNPGHLKVRIFEHS